MGEGAGQIKAQYGRLHLVVNNAGSKLRAKVSNATNEEWDNAVAVNYTATYNSVAVCLPHMLEHGEGSHIVVTSSMSGLLPGGNLGVYTATKIAAVGLIEALRVELEGTTVGTSAFCPGGVNTDLFILSHPEFKPGIQERFDAIMLSTPSVETPIPQDRVGYEKVVLRCGIYPREIDHRKKKRKSYRSV